MYPYRFFIGDIVLFDNPDADCVSIARIESISVSSTGKVTYDVEGHIIRNIPEADLTLILRSEESRKHGVCL